MGNEINDAIDDLMANGLSIPQAAKEVGVSVPTIWRWTLNGSRGLASSARSSRHELSGRDGPPIVVDNSKPPSSSRSMAIAIRFGAWEKRKRYSPFTAMKGETWKTFRVRR